MSYAGCSSIHIFGSGSGYLEEGSSQQGSSRVGSGFTQGEGEEREQDVSIEGTTPGPVDTSMEGSQLQLPSGGEVAPPPQQPGTASTGKEGKVSEVMVDLERVWGENALYELAGCHSRTASEDKAGQ